MFQAEAYTTKRVYVYRTGGIIPSYDDYAIKQAEKEGRVKYLKGEEHAFTAYGSSREETMKAIDRLADYYNIKITRVQFIDD